MTDERLRRWRLVLGGTDEDGQDGTGYSLAGNDQAVDEALDALYGAPDDGEANRTGTLSKSAPRVARWLGDIRGYFPSTVVQVMQRDAVERLGLTRMLLEPELLSAVEPDVHLIGTLLALQDVLPERTRHTARQVVRQVVEQLEHRLADRAKALIAGALRRADRTNRPRPSDIDWDRTIRANLKHYSPELATVIPQRLVGHARRQTGVARDVILAVDQSGSMAESAVYAGIYGSVLASMRSLRTHLVAFDTAIVDLTDQLDDPVDVLFGIQLGGGTDINRAIAYCQGLVTNPTDTVLVLISDLYEGGVLPDLLRRVASLVEAGVTVVVLLALADSGRPAYDRENAAALHELGVPAFACTPVMFGEMMAAAIRREDLNRFVAAAP